MRISEQRGQASLTDTMEFGRYFAGIDDVQMRYSADKRLLPYFEQAQAEVIAAGERLLPGQSAADILTIAQPRTDYPDYFKDEDTPANAVRNVRKTTMEALGTLLVPRTAAEREELGELSPTDGAIEPGVLAVPPFGGYIDDWSSFALCWTMVANDLLPPKRRFTMTQNARLWMEGKYDSSPTQEFTQYNTEIYLRALMTPKFREESGYDVRVITASPASTQLIGQVATRMRTQDPMSKVYCLADVAPAGRKRLSQWRQLVLHSVTPEEGVVAHIPWPLSYRASGEQRAIGPGNFGREWVAANARAHLIVARPAPNGPRRK